MLVVDASTVTELVVPVRRGGVRGADAAPGPRGPSPWPFAPATGAGPVVASAFPWLPSFRISIPCGWSRQSRRLHDLRGLPAALA